MLLLLLLLLCLLGPSRVFWLLSWSARHHAWFDERSSKRKRTATEAGLAKRNRHFSSTDSFILTFSWRTV